MTSKMAQAIIQRPDVSKRGEISPIALRAATTLPAQKMQVSEIISQGLSKPRLRRVITESVPVRQLFDLFYSKDVRSDHVPS